MSTDTAFALGVLALVAPRGATRLRVFLLTLAIVDDLVGLLVITTVYSGHVDVVALGIAVAMFGALLALRFAPVGALGGGHRHRRGHVGRAWKSGVHPAIAGLAIGLVTSAYPPSRSDLERATALVRAFREQPTPELARSAQLSLLSAISANERLQHRLHPWTSYVVVPVFALANAGIHVRGGAARRRAALAVTLGIFFAYVVGKPLGIVCSSWLASRPAFGAPHLSISLPGLVGVGTVAGIGFTVSLLISSLAFRGEALDEAKLGILAGAIAATLVARATFRLIALIPGPARARQLRDTADALVDLAVDVDPARDHIRGPDDAGVTLLEYGDYECPYCGQAEGVIRELLASFGDDLRYVWRHLPLNDVHPHAQLAAEAAEAAGAQGASGRCTTPCWPTRTRCGRSTSCATPSELGLDVARFWDELRRRVHAPRVAEDVASADASGVSGTPTLLHQRPPALRPVRPRDAHRGRAGRSGTRGLRSRLGGRPDRLRCRLAASSAGRLPSARTAARPRRRG